MLSREGNRFSPILMKQGATFSEEEWQEQMEKLESEERFKIKKMSNSSESESEETESDDDNQETESVKECALESENDEINNDESSNTDNEISENNEIENQNLQVLTAQELEKYQEKISKSGVCYMSRIPPFMKPSKLRALLTKYGEIGRIYLNPEDFKVSERRRKYKKNKRINYVEGWIEFADKRVARKVAGLLNNNNMGGKKRSYYHDDIWNIKYLPKFKWNNLTEQLAYELKVKEQKMKNEMAQVKRENKFYLNNVKKAKMIDAIEAKKIEKGGDVKNVKKMERTFRQRKVINN